MNTTNQNMVPALTRGAVLVELSITTFSGRRKDKTTQAEVTRAKGSGSKRAASVYKNLFADCEELDAINNFAAKVRTGTHYRLTQPWSYSGPAILASTLITTYSEDMNEARDHFFSLVKTFLDKYDTLIAAAAFKLGTLFDRREYPSRQEVEAAFSFNVSMTPLPSSGDFRVDLEQAALDALQADYEARMAERTQVMMRDAWDRMYKVLSRMATQLDVDANGKKKKVYDTLLSSPAELCGLLKHFNVTGDPTLEAARKQLEDMLFGVSADALRTEDDTRAKVKTAVDTMLSTYDAFKLPVLDDEEFIDG